MSCAALGHFSKFIFEFVPLVSLLTAVSTPQHVTKILFQLQFAEVQLHVLTICIITNEHVFLEGQP